MYWCGLFCVVAVLVVVTVILWQLLLRGSCSCNSSFKVTVKACDSLLACNSLLV